MKIGSALTRSRRAIASRILFASAVVLSTIPVASPAGGIVTNCTEAALQGALAGGGVVTFACDGTITLTQPVTIIRDTVIDATGHDITLSGGGTVRLFSVDTNRLTLLHLKLEHGCGGFVGGGAIYISTGTVNATNSTFSGNSALQQGIQPTGSGPPARGGAILNASGTVNLDGCVFVDNASSGWAGGLAIYPFGLVGLPGSDGSGGAIASSGSVCVTGCTFLRNSAVGGAAADMQASALPGSGGGAARGGAIHNQGTLIIERSYFANNQAAGGRGGNASAGPAGPQSPANPGGSGGYSYGGAIGNEGSLGLADITFTMNSCAGGAGGMGGPGGAYVLPDGSIGGTGGPGGVGGNANGAALHNGNSGSVNLTNNTFASNTGSGGAGGAGGPGGTGYIDGHENHGANGAAGSAGTGVGALYTSSLQLNLKSCTIAFNSGSGIAGCALNGGNLINTLLATNSPRNGTTSVTDLGHNLSSDSSCAFSSPSSLNNTDPKLAPLADNGGPVPTMKLLSGSPAIDAGDTASATAADARGLPRPLGPAVDIGAFEFGVWVPAIGIASNQDGVDLRVFGRAGQTCRLLTSTNLSAWIGLATNQLTSDGTALFHAKVDPSDARRFYWVNMQ